MSMPDSPSYNTTQPISTSNNRFPSEGPKTLPTVITFPEAGRALVDLTTDTMMHRISQIQGLYLDNTNGPNLILESDVTGQTIHIPTGAQGYFQLLSQNPPKFYVTADAATTEDLIFHFLNFPVLHSVNIPSGSGGGIESVQAGANVTIDDTDPRNPIISATGGGSGGGGGVAQFSPAVAPATITAADITGATHTPQFVLTSTSVDLDFNGLATGTYLILIQPYAGAATINSPNSNMFDKADPATNVLNVDQKEIIQLMVSGDGGTNWSVAVMGRY